MRENCCILFLLLLFLFSLVESLTTSNQLASKKVKMANVNDTIMIMSAIPSMTASLSIGKGGPLLLQDANLISQIVSINRVRTTPRLIHAKGTGAYGYFEVTHDFKKYTKSALLNGVGKRTPILVRFSLLNGNEGTPDTTSDLRGFAIKFYKENEGTWDLVGNSIDAFPLRDPLLFPSLVRSMQKNPKTNQPDPNAFWDFRSLRPETLFHLMMCFSDLGNPDGYRHMDGHAGSTFRLVNAANEVHLAKFHWLTDQGLKNLSDAEYTKLANSDPEYATKDLYDSIANSKFPSWTFYAQIMTLKDGENYKWSPYDATKIWPQEQVKLIPVGKIVLNRNPKDFQLEVEQAAFNPAAYIHGIEMSQDPTSNVKGFAYSDAQRYRLGDYFEQFPVNRPRTSADNEAGREHGECQGIPSEPNYYPNSLVEKVNSPESTFKVEGIAGRMDLDAKEGMEDHFSQPKMFWDKLNEGEKSRMVQRFVGSLKGVEERILTKVLRNFDLVDVKLGKMIREAMK